MQVKLTGHIKRIAETQHFGENFCKRSVIIETQEKYPQVLEIELHQDRVDLIDPYTEGEKATFHINVRGREWTSPKSEVRYFITLIAWKIEKTDTSSNGQSEPTFQGQKDEDEDDLPF
ncbi:MAG TPA: hypothetical protein DCG19_03830 [Cryomorphaceae bacterium]|nr:hypothetical protein [Owenweeksia sp.]MBF97864.1 hypothetical protein [Owenweeksia sp.]HAD96509.1 hypothetical protein [Cryomorphaceae bacterium]HBF19790.1 hypothetical protein [Cryomorphaceae bacterium]HCQ17124.1 hypothetical protein [Cryomorphaceae bacterium]|tara:strand:+ start:1359 stop:1712 length:354 start_codon:yes stop_codon:yes gene_type:complete